MVSMLLKTEKKKSYMRSTTASHVFLAGPMKPPQHFTVSCTWPSWRPSGSWSTPYSRSAGTRRPPVARRTSSRRTCRRLAAQTRPPGRWAQQRPWPSGCRTRCCCGRTAAWWAPQAAPWRPPPGSSWSSWPRPVWARAVPWSLGTWTWPAEETAVRISSAGACLDL